MAGSIVGALAQDMNWLIFARALQGLGGGGLMILSQAVIADVIPPRDRGRYMGIIGGVFAFSSVAGPLIGGWITEGPGWRWAFWLNLPLAILSILAVIFLLPHRPFREREKHSIDYLGSLILMAGTSALVLATIWGGNQYEWASPQIIGLLIFSVVAALVFIPVENRAAEPVMPMYLFKNRNFLLTLGASLALGCGNVWCGGVYPDLSADGAGCERYGGRSADDSDDGCHAGGVDCDGPRGVEERSLQALRDERYRDCGAGPVPAVDRGY